jgi:hypothetical protein
MEDMKQKEVTGDEGIPSEACPIGPFSLGRPYLFTFPQSPKIVPPVGDQVFST